MPENRYQSTDPNELIRELKNIRQTLESHTDHDQFKEEAEYYQMFVDVIGDLENLLGNSIDQVIEDATAIHYKEYPSIHHFLEKEELYEEFKEFYDLDEDVRTIKAHTEIVTETISDPASCMRKLLSEYRNRHFTIHYHTDLKGRSVFKIYELRLEPALKSKSEV